MPYYATMPYLQYVFDVFCSEGSFCDISVGSYISIIDIIGVQMFTCFVLITWIHRSGSRHCTYRTERLNTNIFDYFCGGDGAIHK